MELHDNKNTRLSNALAVFGFCLTVFIPFIFGFVQSDLEISTSENRKLAIFPQAPQSVAEIQAYPEALAGYYSDHFGFRDFLVGQYKNLKFALGDSTSENLTLGKDGWMFLGNTNEAYKKHGDPFGDVRNKNVYSEKELDAFANNISAFKDWLKERGVEYVFVIAPNKHTIYFDKLPDYVKRVDKHSATDQLVEHLTKNTDVEIVDLRAALLEGKQHQQVYFKTDTHWNHYGANIAQYEIMKRIDSKFPNMITLEKHEMTSKETRRGDLANMLGVKIPEEDYPRPIFSNQCKLTKYPEKVARGDPYSWSCEGKNLNALIYKDSFFLALEQYFKLNFRKSTYIPNRATYESVVEQLSMDKPDVLIEEWVERKLPRSYSSRYNVAQPVKPNAEPDATPARQKNALNAQSKIRKDSKVLIDDLINKIDEDDGNRAKARLQRGEILDVQSYADKEGAIISLQDNAFYFGVDNCDNVDEFDSWNFLSFPFKVNTDIDVDERSPSKNLKYIIRKNAYVAKIGDTSTCLSHVEFSRKDIYKVSASKMIGKQKHWSFEKKFKEEVDYLRENKPKERVKDISKNSVICNVSARLCYTNGRKPKFLSSLSVNGLLPLENRLDEDKSDKDKLDKEDVFYLQTRDTLVGLSTHFPKFQLREINSPQSAVANFITKNLNNTVILSVRDNAMGRFKESDINELKKVGVDLSNLKIRGAHISIIRPGHAPVNESENKGLITMLPEQHNIPHLGIVSSAGFAHGDHSVINVKGINASVNYRGINIVVIDSKGEVVSSKNFDTHTSAYRTQGLFEASVF